MFDMDKGSRGPDPYKLLTPRFLLLSLVLRLHCGAVVEKQATLGTTEEAFDDETWAIRLASGLIVLEGPIVIIVPVVGIGRGYSLLSSSHAFANFGMP
jgi:hypothetical protein